MLVLWMMILAPLISCFHRTMSTFSKILVEAAQRRLQVVHKGGSVECRLSISSGVLYVVGLFLRFHMHIVVLLFLVLNYLATNF
jgi:hypothetical protein